MRWSRCFSEQENTYVNSFSINSFVEKILGVGFRLHGDVVPNQRKNKDFSLPLHLVSVLIYYINSFTNIAIVRMSFVSPLSFPIEAFSLSMTSQKGKGLSKLGNFKP